MEEYSYEPLPANTIRVLHLDPGSPDSPLTGTLEPHPLPQPLLNSTTTAETNNDLPASNYDCVSYVWGGDTKPSTILISGVPLPITATLDSLLRRLRKWQAADATAQRLWADAICINQSDPVEKGVQVAQMPAIYRAARRVVVDLGEESDDLDDALWLMSAWWKKHIWSGLASDRPDAARGFTMQDSAMLRGFELPDPEEREAFEAVELPEPTDPRWDCVARFFCRSWFGRVWVVQEFVLAREVVMICGEREIPWRDVVAATQNTVSAGTLPVRAGHGMSVFSRYAFPLMAYHRQIRILQQTREGKESLRILEGTSLVTPEEDYALDLYSLLEMLQSAKATRRRDKYFAVMGLAADVEVDEPELRPDYVSPIEAVITRVGRWLFKHGHCTDILLSSGISVQSGMKLPSWVPDFSGASGRHISNRSTSISEHYDAAKGTRFRGTMTPRIDHLVTISGMFVDAVDREPFSALPLQDLLMYSSDGSTDNGKSYTLLLLRHLIYNVRSVFHDVASTYSIPTELSDEALTSAILFGSEDLKSGVGLKDRYGAIGFRFVTWIAVYRHLVDDLTETSFAETYRMLGQEFNATNDEIGHSYKKFINSLIAAALRNLQLTRTRRGRVASLPSCFRKGDEICIVQGVSLPLLLRRSTEYPGCYQLVGSCYVHGIMYGEALELGHRFEQVTLC